MSGVLSRLDVVRLAAIVEASRTESEVGLMVDGVPQRGTARQIVGDSRDIRDQCLRITMSGVLCLDWDVPIRELVSSFGDEFVVFGQ
ncbi:hypothetical protein [Nocardia sp. NPDC051570]|uniref:hypothetical protein n=1 Tax=Nocardia sp. NPDC051570 TaxID=3364324 RepID=UPI0037AE2349